jgi:hypothetical protein
MSPIDAMLALLVSAQRDRLNRKETINQFQSLVWDGREFLLGQDGYNVLADLAYDLDFFEPDPAARSKDSSYYGHDRLEEEIGTALQRLAGLGFAVPHDLPRGKPLARRED